MPHFMRPREKMREKGPNSLTDQELIALILRSGSTQKSVLEIAEDISSKYVLTDLQNISRQEKLHVKGLGESGIAALLAAIELGKRVNKYDMMPAINTPEDVIKTVSFIRDKKREYFVGLYLNARKQLITTQVISIGTLDMSIAHPREVFDPAIKNSASVIIIAHNHPSGDPDPSNADILLTRRLVEAGSILDIQIQDHIILAKHRYLSLAQSDLL